MKLASVLPELSILPLRRFADAWDVRTIKSDKRDVFEQAILSDLARIDSDDATKARLNTFDRELNHIHRRNALVILRLLIDEPEYRFADESDLIQRAVSTDASFHEYAASPIALRHLDARTVDVYQSVLAVAWENNVSFDEYQLIKRLQRKLSIVDRDHRVIETLTAKPAQMGPPEAQQALKDLVSHGFACQFKLRGQTEVVVPEEIALRLRLLLGISLQSSAYRNLAAKLPIKAIREALEHAGQPFLSQRKDFLVERLIDGDVPPATVLECLDDAALDELLADFPGERASRRGVKIRHIVSHYDKFASKSAETTPEDPDKTYFTYLTELASRKYETLRSSGVIQNDQNVDRAFERGVRYAFSSLLGHPAIQFSGSAHADGGVPAKRGRMVLWDCKSALRPYAMTEPKSAQFLQYVTKESPNVVCPFLVISGEFTEESASQAIALKSKCSPGTEIGLLTAANLKWLAEKWNKEYPGKSLPLDVLAHTGAITTAVLELRLKLFANQND